MIPRTPDASRNTTAIPGWVDYALLSGLSVLFGSSFVFTSVAVRDMPPLTVVLGRLSLAAMVFLVILGFSRASLPRRARHWALIFLAAAFGYTVPFTLITWGQVRVEAGLTAILMAIMPLVTVVLAHCLIPDEKMNRYKMLGVVCGLIGVTVLMGWGTLSTLGDDSLRQYAIAIAAVCYAVNAILTKKLVDVPKLPLLAALMVTASLQLMPFAFWFDEPWSLAPSIASISSVIVLGLFPTALATLMILIIIDRQGASFLSQINFMVPVVGALLGILFLHEQLPANAWLALVIILTGISLSRVGSAKPRA